jgi:caffeoyl-CoA O-methyltransferase
VVDVSLSDYGEKLFGAEDPTLRSMREDAEREGIPAIQVSPELGRLLQLMVKVSGAKSILEIGALFGYSSLLMARALPADGRVVSLEVNPKHAAIARRNLEQAGLEGKVDIREGAAIDTLSSLTGPFDLVFIDADKESYPQYLDAALRLTRRGSVIIADNVWRGGAVTDPRDETTRAIAEFNHRIANEPRLLSTLISHRDCGDAASVSYVEQ